MSPSEDILIKKILDLQVKLLNDHNLPSLFSYHSKNGQVNFGSKHVISKFRNDFDCNWEETFDADRKELMRQTSEMPPYYDEEEWGKPINFVKAHLPPMKLPADLDLCVQGIVEVGILGDFERILEEGGSKSSSKLWKARVFGKLLAK